MSALELLHADDPRQRLAWMEAWQSWGEAEPMAHPAWAELHAGSGERAACFVQHGPSGGILLPAILRPLALQAWARGSDAWDLASPYGYGGPFAWGAPDAPAFWTAFAGTVARLGIVTSFVRMSLFADQAPPVPWAAHETGPNVVLPLAGGPEAAWRGFKATVRRRISRARREGLVAEVDEGGRRLAAFVETYHDTMQRRQASGGYFFPLAFFQRLVAGLPGGVVFVHALLDDAVVSTECVLASRRHAYSFLAATRQECFKLHPNDLVKWQVVQWAHATGREAYVLGGGPTGRDGVFEYKLAFAPGGEVPFHTLRLVHDPQRHDALLAARAAAEPAGWTPRPGYFPAYRS